MTLDFANLMTVAALGLLIVLRVDARRFGAADFDDETAISDWHIWMRRLTWYALGTVLVLAAYLVFPQPGAVLHLRLGDDRLFALMAGLSMATLGVGAAVLYALLRFREVSLPVGRAYPVGLLNSVATAFIDEGAFRGILLGLLLFSNWPPLYAVAFQAVAYALATRLGGAGRPRSLLILWLVVGFLSGWLTYLTGGIGAALLAHALTRFAIFVATGHAGQITPVAVSEEEAYELTEVAGDEGLEVVPDREPGHLRPIE
ncbi:MAG TPA: CPBP family intramembrane glutamic endopeptidase [Candidatus Limnocylindria bacterium]|nr:CPBP family intramembrane glutamic endopeptidase [Candidatus Limnocylindria bacterium]